MAVSYSSVTQPGLLAQQYPPALLPKPGKDNARLQKLLKKSAKKKAAPQTIQTPAPFRSSLSPVNEASADLEHSDHSTPPKTPETPSFASQPPRFSVRPLYQHVSSPYPQQRGLPYGRTSLFSPQPSLAPANVHPPYFYTAPPQQPQYIFSPPAPLTGAPLAGAPVVPGSVTQAVTALTPGPTSSVSKITMPTAEMRIAAPIPVAETVSHAILKPTTVISPLMKPRSPRPTFKASISRSPKPMFEVPQIQMYTANTYEVIKMPLHDSAGLSAIGGTATQRQTPTSEVRRGLTPTPEVKRVLTPTSEVKSSVTPTSDVKKGLTPTSEIKRALTPTSEIKRALTPTSEIKRALTPTSEIKRALTPTSEIKRALTPTSEIKRALTPTSEIKRTLTPTSEIRRALTPTSEIRRALTPTSEIRRALTPTSEIKRSVTPTSDVRRGLTPTSEILRSKTPTYDSSPSRTSSGRPKTPSYHVTRSKTPVFEISRPNPLLFAVSPITTETQRSKPPTPVFPSTETQTVKPPTVVSPSTETQTTKPPAPVSPSKETQRSKPPTTVSPSTEIQTVKPPTVVSPSTEIQTAKPPSAVSPSTEIQTVKPPTVVSPSTEIQTAKPPSAVSPSTEIQTVKPPTVVSPTAPTTETKQSKEVVNAKSAAMPNGVISLHENVSKPDAPRPEAIDTVKSVRPKTPTAPLGYQRPKTPTHVSPTTTTYGYQRPRTPSYESPVAPTYGYQRPKTPSYEGPKPPTPATQISKTPTYESAKPRVQSLRNQRPKTPIYGPSPRVSPLPFQRPKTPTYVAPQPKSTYYGLTPAEYVAHGGIQSYTPSFGLSRSKTPTQEESKTTASEDSNAAQQETVRKTQSGTGEVHKEDVTVSKQEVTSTPAMIVPTIVVSQASDVPTVSSHEPQTAETPRVQAVSQETPKISSVPEAEKTGIKTPAKKTKVTPVAEPPKAPVIGIKPPALPPANTPDSNKAPLAKDAKQTAEKVNGTATNIAQTLNQTGDTKGPPKLKAPIKQVADTKMVESVSTISTPIEKDSSKAVPESQIPVKKMDRDQDKVKPDPTLVPSEKKATCNDLPTAEPLLKVIQKPKGMKSKLSGWSRLKKHMVVEVEEPKFPETESKSEAKKEEGTKISETRDVGEAAVKASEKSGSEDGDKSEPLKPKTVQMWDAVLFQMFSTKENIMQQIEASRSEDEKEDSKDASKEVPAFAHRLPVLLFSPKFDAKRLREAASRPLTKISTVFEMGLIGRKNKDEEPKDFNRTARGFAAP